MSGSECDAARDPFANLAGYCIVVVDRDALESWWRHLGGGLRKDEWLPKAFEQLGAAPSYVEVSVMAIFGSTARRFFRCCFVPRPLWSNEIRMSNLRCRPPRQIRASTFEIEVTAESNFPVVGRFS
jgi:hypothetical protein